jgi:hypothetical protein
LDNLLDIRVRGMITDEEFGRQKEKLLLEQHGLKGKLDDFESGVKGRLELSEKLVFFANKAAKVFERATLQQKRLILEIAGSNLFLRDRILHIEAKKPFVAAGNMVPIPVWQAQVHDIRTFCLNRQIDVDKWLQAFRELEPLLIMTT